MNAPWSVAEMPSQAGKRFLMTGANSGVGYAAAVELVRRGAVMVMACRDRARGEDALRRLRVEAAGPESAATAAELAILDLASLESVRQVAQAEVARGLPLNGLINNAGVYAPARRLETNDGFELQFGTNVLGHFALTCELMPALERADAARVVTLASIAHKRARIDFDDLQSERRYKPFAAYGQSKLADLMFAFELERRLRAGGFRTISIAVHPGVAPTNLFKIGSSKGAARVAEKTLQKMLGLLFNSQAGGAVPTLFGATAAAATGGSYYGSQGFQEMRGGDVGPAEVSRAARDAGAQQRLWQVCEELTGTTLPAIASLA